jgi:predicted small integral membrane protein
MEWMHWTVPSAIGFLALFVMLAALAYLDKVSPSYGRKGFLPIVTTRGDRVFMAIISMVLIFFLWLKFFPEVTLWGAVAISAAVMTIFLKWA